jgi:cytochrome c-type biogenesis protein CcmH/NrfF
MFRKFRKALLIFLLATTPLALAADRERVKALGDKFMCVCGTCNQQLMHCNHLGCPSSVPMKAELAEKIDEGLSDDGVTTYFVEKYGVTVLSAPPVSGFNLAAWIMPFAALAVGAVMVLYFVRRFRSRWAGAPASGSTSEADLAKYQNKVEEELQKYNPED